MQLTVMFYRHKPMYMYLSGNSRTFILYVYAFWVVTKVDVINSNVYSSKLT